MKVIPTISWGDERSFDFCFDGVEQGSIVAVCTYYRENNEDDFVNGFNKMLEKIKPWLVLCYDEPFKSMKGNIKYFLPTTYEWVKELDWESKAQFYWEKQNRNIMGYNKNDFKFMKYKDLGEKVNMAKCQVCGKICLIDEYGNGKCENCGWEQVDKMLENKYGVGYPNLIRLSKAKDLFEQRKPFLPDFEDFIYDLMFYGEMEFCLYNVKFIVERYSDNGSIEIYSENNPKDLIEFKDIKSFAETAKIDGQLLKDLWPEVKNINWLS